MRQAIVTDIGQRGGGRLVDEDWFAFGDGPELFQVGSAIDAFDHEDVALVGEFVEVVDDFNASLFQLLDVAWHAILNFLRGCLGLLPPGKGGDDFDCISKKAGGLGVVDEFRERIDVRKCRSRRFRRGERLLWRSPAGRR